MRKININNPEELKKFKLETHGFVSSYDKWVDIKGFGYRECAEKLLKALE